jgi:hypothetical protein
MATLRDILHQEVLAYAGDMLNGTSWLVVDEARNNYVVMSEGYQRGQRFFDFGIVARVVHDIIVIEMDQNNKPLVDALIQKGIPREQIVLAYAGESVGNLAAKHLDLVLKQTLRNYVEGLLSEQSYMTTDAQASFYSVVSLVQSNEHRSSQLAIAAQVQDTSIVILQDATDKPLVDALMQSGVPREQIILAYAGEHLPEPEPHDTNT